MKSYWLTFTDGTKASCDGESEYDAKKIAEKLSGKTVAGGEFKDIAAQILPYPATPNIWTFEHPLDGKCPSFCYRPNQCAGKTSCPQNRSCTE